jgi:cytidylate kinase
MVIPSRTSRFIIAIDGPSGAGKSTVARTLARHLHYIYIDTGAMYRAVALRAKERGVTTANEEALARLSASLRITFAADPGENRVLCDEEDVTEAIRSPEISLLASEISRRGGVRRALVDMQREMGGPGGVVLEGRDIGTVVFPDAEIKFYLDASPEERARRRFEELRKKGLPVRFEETLEEVIRRDHNDMSRTISPLRRAEDAILIDSTDLSVEQVVEMMVREVRKRERPEK